MLAGYSVSVPVQLNSAGNESSLAFSLTFDPAQLEYVSTSGGTGAAAATLIVNDRNTAAGRLGVVVSRAPGSSFAAGPAQVAAVNFRARATASGTTSILFSDSPAARAVVDARAAPLTASFTGGTVTIGTAKLRANPQAAPGGPFRVRMDLDNGGQLSTADAGSIEVWWAASPAAPLAEWTRLTNGISLINGALQVQDAGSTGSLLRFYKIIQRH